MSELVLDSKLKTRSASGGGTSFLNTKADFVQPPERKRDVFYSESLPTSPDNICQTLMIETPLPFDNETGTDNHHVLADSSKKSRRKLTPKQVDTLEDQASRDLRPSLEIRRHLAEQLELDLRVVSVWFQNRRRPTTSSKLQSATATAAQARKKGAFMKQVMKQERRRYTRTRVEDSEISIVDVDTSSASSDTTTKTDLWRRLPSSSPVQHDKTIPFMRDRFVPKKGSLEWACSRLYRTQTEYGEPFTSAPRSNKLLQTSTQWSAEAHAVAGFEIPETVWDVYGRDAVEVALVLVQMKCGEI